MKLNAVCIEVGANHQYYKTDATDPEYQIIMLSVTDFENNIQVGDRGTICIYANGARGRFESTPKPSKEQIEEALMTLQKVLPDCTSIIFSSNEVLMEVSDHKKGRTFWLNPQQYADILTNS